MDTLTMDVNNHGLEQPPASSLQETDVNISPNSQGVIDGEDFEKNREAEALRKIKKAEDEAAFWRKHAEQQHLVFQQNINRLQQTQQPQKQETEEALLLKITDEQLNNMAELSEQHAIEAGKIRTLRDNLKEEMFANKITEKILSNPRFTVKTEDYETKIRNAYPELNDPTSEAFQSFAQEYHRLGVKSGEAMLIAAENASLRHPHLFNRNKAKDNREKMIDNHMKNGITHSGKNIQAKGEERKLTQEDIEVAKFFGIDQKKLIAEYKKMKQT